MSLLMRSSRQALNLLSGRRQPMIKFTHGKANKENLQTAAKPQQPNTGSGSTSSSAQTNKGNATVLSSVDQLPANLRYRLTLSPKAIELIESGGAF